MSSELEGVLEQLERLSFDELLTLQEQLTQQLRTKGAPSNTQTIKQPGRKIKIPGAYQPTAEEVEASLAKIFTPKEMAEMDKVDLDNLPVGAKSLSEMINEDREDRF